MTITSRTRISEQAREAARFQVANPSMKVRNPYTQDEPEHFCEWRREFDLGCLEFSAEKQGVAA